MMIATTSRPTSAPTTGRRPVSRSTSIQSRPMSGKRRGKSSSRPTSPRSDKKDSVSDSMEGKKLSMESILEELAQIFGYVNEFLQKVPEEILYNFAYVVKIKQMGKDEVIFEKGDMPNMFYVLLTGQVDLDPQTGNSKDIKTLKKGKNFGEMSILTGQPHPYAAYTASNCTFLTLTHEDFQKVLGPYFQYQQCLAVDFMKEVVPALCDLPQELLHQLALYLQTQKCQIGNEWDPATEDKIYFVRDGLCSLQSIDYKTDVLDTTKQMLRNPAYPTMGDNGVLAHVQIADGRLIGTLGQEQKLKALQKKLIPQVHLGKLGPGNYFGGGNELMGQGELQTSLKITTETIVSVYYIQIQDIIQHLHPVILQRLRDYSAFMLTYYFGRVGMIENETIVGHPSTSLRVHVSEAKRENEKFRKKEKKRQMFNSKSYDKKTGQYGKIVDGCLEHVELLQKNHQKELQEAQYNGGTPTDRYWRSPYFSKSTRTRQLDNLLEYIYPKGVGPLVDKLDKLQKIVENKKQPKNGELKRPQTALLPTNKSQNNKNKQQQQQQFTNNKLVRPGTSRPYKQQQQKQQESLTAACIIWDRSTGKITPMVRQCLTYAEVYRQFHN